ncbi:MAG: hypothetical protein AB7G48_03025 [Nitrospiraceae bacterium]
MNKRLVTGLGVLGMMIWLALFSAGLLLDSAPYRKAIAAAMKANQSVLLEDVILASLLFTPTNVAFLSVLAGFLGGCTSVLNDRHLLQEEIHRAQEVGDQGRVSRLERRIRFMGESPIVSMMRGFVVYLAIISGIFLVISNPFDNPSMDQFIRLAGLFSVVAFMMGYDPTRFEDLLEKVSSLSQKPPPRNP